MVFEFSLSIDRKRCIHVLITLVALYAVLIFFEIPIVRGPIQASLPTELLLVVPLNSEEETSSKFSPLRPYKIPMISRIVLNHSIENYSDLHRSAREAWLFGRKLFEELSSDKVSLLVEKKEAEEICPTTVSLNGEALKNLNGVIVLPCGLRRGSYITVEAKPRSARPVISDLRKEEKSARSLQFMIELQGLKTVDGEEPPRILHFNPRLKGDWSGRAVIEQNTCYRMQWGAAQRCDGRKSRPDEGTVDGQLRCEKWRTDDFHSEELNSKWWMNNLAGRKIMAVSSELAAYPFEDDKIFLLTLTAGLQGYHANVNGRHVASFPHRVGFALEDATGLSIAGDVEVQSVFAASLPVSHPSFAPQRSLEMLPKWQAPHLQNGDVELFIGIISSGNHFSERMAVRKSWMEAARNSPNIVARFFVALHGRKEVNVELKKEAEYFGDIVIVPYMDSYDLVVLKTIAICEYAMHTFKAKNVMKCDDDTFVSVDSLMTEIQKVPVDKSLYVGNINYYHKPLRHGKWAVTYEEWPEEDYPPYANGPGYVVSSDIANFVVTEFEKNTLRLFKMEDVSMGMWVEQFNRSRPVEYIHSFKFCQFGCIEGYVTAHYQSPRQMACLWSKLLKGKPMCCNMR